MKETILECLKRAEIGEFSIISDGKLVGFEKTEEEKEKEDK